MPKPRGASRVTPARKVALRACATARRVNSYVAAVLDAELAKETLSVQDRAFARLLALGSTSVLLALDCAIDSILRSPNDIDASLRDALRLSTYELLYLDKDAHVAVDQGVELARMVAPRAAGVANFVLRRVGKLKEQGWLEDLKSSAHLEEFALSCGIPDWLACDIATSLGNNQARMLMGDSVHPAPLYFTFNTNKVPDCTPASELSCSYHKVSLLGSDSALCAYELDHRAEAGMPDFAKRVASQELIVSDVAAQSVAVGMLPEKKPRRFLEIGAGRGTKTLLIQNAATRLYGSQLTYEVLEIRPSKLQLLQERVQQAGVKVDAFHCADARTLSGGDAGRYDMIFIDAPCSGVGTLRRHPEIKVRLVPTDSEQLASIGLDILRAASSLLAPHGRIVYATCTPLTQENEAVIGEFLQTPEGATFTPIDWGNTRSCYFRSPLVVGGWDYHFACCLEKKFN